MARASRRMQEGEAAAPETPPVTEPIIEGDDDFLADARAALGRWQRGGAGGAGGAGAQRGSKEAEDTIRQILGDGADVVGAGLTGGPIGAGAALGAKLVATIPWEDVFKAIDEAIKAKKSHEVAMATLKSWERIGAAKDLLMALLDDPRFTDEQRARYRAELKPKLSQAQNLASQVRRALENDNLDDAKRFAEALKGVLQQIRTWINNFQP